MNIVVAKSAGFCRGVTRAVRKAQELARESRVIVHTDGPLIHNEQVMADLRAQGIEATDAPELLTGGTLLVRAHGISPQRRQMLKRLPVRLVDATCPDVGRSQGLVQKHARQGYATIIFGDPGHAEVVGLLGCADEKGFVVTSPDDVARLPDLRPVCLCAQSTQFPDDYEAIAAAVRARFPDAVVLNTICEATRRRQSELIEIARRVDAVVVVGSEHSANTRRLVELARRHTRALLVPTADQLRPEDLSGCRTVGLTAGASTPEDIIDAVRRRLEAM